MILKTTRRRCDPHWITSKAEPTIEPLGGNLHRGSCNQNYRFVKASKGCSSRQSKSPARRVSNGEPDVENLVPWIVLLNSSGIMSCKQGAEAFLKALLNNINKPQSPGFHVLGLVTCCCNQADTLPPALPSAFIENSAATKPTVFVEVSNKKAAQFKTSKNRQEDPMRIARKRESDRILD